MPASKSPLRYALLTAMILQLLPALAYAADDDDDEDDGRACEDCPLYVGWSGWVEGGLGHQNRDSTHYGRFTGHHDKGGFINADANVRYRAVDGTYANIQARDMGLDSRDLILSGGKQGKYGVTFEFDQIPNYRDQDAYSPLRKQGKGNLGLPPSWVAGPDTNNMPTLTSNLKRATLKTRRDRTGVSFNYIPLENWEITGFFQEEKKKGTREVGAGFGFGSMSLLPANMDYRTDNFGLTLGFKGKSVQTQLAYTGSLFKNDQAAITFENPFSTPIGASSGRIADAPDNQFHQLSGLLGYQITDKTRLNAQLSYGRLTQDKSYLPYSSMPGFGSPTVKALDGRVDTKLAKLGITSRPTPRLQLNANYTYSDRDNKTKVQTYEYIITDLYQGMYPGTSTNIQIQNRPYSFKQNLLRTKAAYLLPMGANLSGGFDYDQMERTYLQVKETKDKTLWGKLQLHPTETLETSLKWSHSRRSASSYRNDPTLEHPVYANHPLMRALQLADRKRDKVVVGLSYNPMAKLSLGLDLDYYKDDYDKTVFGLHQAKGYTLTPTASYMFSDALTGSLFYAHDKLSSRQKGTEWLLPPSTLDDRWAASDSNLTQTLGLNLDWKAIPNKLDLGADLVYADFSGKTHYQGAPSLPELESTLTALGVHGTFRKDKQLSYRADYRYERYKESDWAKSSLPSVLDLAQTPSKQEMHLIYFSVRYSFE